MNEITQADIVALIKILQFLLEQQLFKEAPSGDWSNYRPVNNSVAYGAVTA